MKKLVTMIIASALSSSIAFGLSLSENAPVVKKYQGSVPAIRISPEMQRRRELKRLNDLLATTTDKKEIEQIKKQIEELKKRMPHQVAPYMEPPIQRHVKDADGNVVKKTPIY